MGKRRGARLLQRQQEQLGWRNEEKGDGGWDGLSQGGKRKSFIDTDGPEAATKRPLSIVFTLAQDIQTAICIHSYVGDRSSLVKPI